jgi:hypothetical protein
MYLWIIFAWSLVGGIILAIASNLQRRGALYMADGWEFVNPVHIYKYNKVNWFGAIIVALIYNAFCPIGSVCYWFYKLCTVGRK